MVWLQYLITIVLTVISGVLTFIVTSLVKDNKRLRKEKREATTKTNKALSDGVMSLLKIQLIEYHDKYMRGGEIPSYVYENWDNMYKAYRNLGGNGMVEHMNEEIHRLELRKEDADNSKEC